MTATTQTGMTVLAIAGSLRSASINVAFCKAAIQLAPSELRIEVFDAIGGLPLFNPDLENCLPSPVLAFRAAVTGADALLIASPEYAHGVSGVMKNALDWLVGDETFDAKPVAVVNTSHRAYHAHDSLLEVLRTMSACLIQEASITVPMPAACKTTDQILGCAGTSAHILQVLTAIHFHLVNSQPSSGKL